MKSGRSLFCAKWAVFLAAAIPSASSQILAAPALPRAPGCEAITAKDCVELALTAMGGRDRLAALKSVRLDVIAHTALMEQSYRQAPFITSYERDKDTLDLAGQRLLSQQHSVWPESDPGTAESDITFIAGPSGAVYQSGGKDSPASGADIDSSRQTLALGPERLLLNASAASDLHFEDPETVRSSSHAVVAFQWNNIPVRILLNAQNHLPDAVETTQEFRDFWYFWGDVRQVVYWDNWQLDHGVRYPTNQVIERNGAIWSSSQALNVEFNVPIDDKAFAMDSAAALASTQNKGWNRPFRDDKSVELAAGIDLYQGSWNATIVKQADGVVILESPISSSFTEGLFAEARKKYPGAPIKAVLTTSDSWPHVGGIRFDVAQGVAIYILDANRPLLDRIVAAPHSLDPDALQQAKKSPRWTIVSGKTELGSGDNRLILFPIRGASTERQYMVYFPERRLLYASDTMVVNPTDHTLYDPELMREVELAVEREHLAVDKVYAMHQGPVAWSEVVSMLEKAMV
jgi:hypothetical protein